MFGHSFVGSLPLFAVRNKAERYQNIEIFLYRTDVKVLFYFATLNSDRARKSRLRFI